VSDPRNVFVVYGRNELARKAVFDLLRALNLRPLEWDEIAAKAGPAPFIFEVLQKGFEIAQAVLVVLTPDELARLRPELVSEQGDRVGRYQPRPNVLFEAGMAFMRDRNRTFLVELDTSIQAIHSDLSGIHTLRMGHGEQSHYGTRLPNV
jgi:predicted nucleotide-binding protein